ncbi:hypothetical protein [Pelagibacterium xiamenense]|uniref:hypothetical protein n=1 Tax=Pelagibacterium xiamenense TaxID=2901140 RepID=UPI001E3BA374|nr:hypothetical protein [Pelagibacterium xiamenense]MCD7060308.1 hypothetical protein [Pelagibacterium xiamenense]
MPNASQSEIVKALLETHGRTYCDELGIDIEDNTPSPLFRWLCAAILFSARIGAEQAVKAARALADDGLTTPEKMAAASWEHRVRILNEHGYARYDESTSRMLGETSDMLVESYGGDLRKLREEAGHDHAAMRKALKRFKGLGDVGVDILFREIQTAWPELYPFADRKSLSTADKLGLGDTAEALAKHVAKADFPRLLTALVRTSLKGDLEALRSRAS